jgi:DNA polymerase III subunit gamma/tau
MFETNTAESPESRAAGQSEPADGLRQGEYRVVARRYRPQTFAELVGQEHVGRALAGAIASSRVGHAYLFTGARGVGKTSAARILAKALNCERGPTPTPCGQCDSCEKIAAGDDVDVLEIDGASNRGIDEIRELRHNVGIRPSRSRFKVYIIDEVHMLTREAFNALLKTLEEPPEHVKFIFCTTEAEKIPITILSRCQRFDFAGIQTRQIAERLRQIVETEGIEAEGEALSLLARRAAGSMRDSQSLLEQLLAVGSERITVAEVHQMLGTAGQERLERLVEHVVDRDAAAVLADLDVAVAEGVEVGQLMDQLLGHFRDVMVAAVGCSAESMLHVEIAQFPRVRQSAQRLGVETTLEMMQIIEQTISRLRYSTQPRVLAELALVRMCHLADLAELPALIEQLTSGGVAEQSRADRSRGTGSAAPRSASLAEPKKKAEPQNGGDSAAMPHAQGDASAAGPSSTGLSSTGPSLTPETVGEIWNEVLSRLSDMTAEYAAAFDRVAISAPNHLVVSFRAKYNACKAFCERPEQVVKLERALADVTGRAVRVGFATLDDEPAPQGPGNSPRPLDPQQRLREAAQHPLVRRAVELFDARPLRVELAEREKHT